MDAPPAHENIAPYITIANHLISLGLKAPEIYTQNSEHGFALIEDFGDDTFTSLLAQGADETQLYELAVDVLCNLHQHPNTINIEAPRYDEKRLLDEAVLLPDWFYLAHRDEKIPANARKDYLKAWTGILGALSPVPETLVLRDYHVDNLMRVYKNETTCCGLLDFQDAVIGPTAYDLVSLLEDARRDISPKLIGRMKERYFNAFSDIDQKNFEQWYSVLGAQRHCKVAGIFVRLCLRDGKCHYLEHIPRVTRLLNQHLYKPELIPLCEWLSKFLPEWAESLPEIH